MIPAPATEYPPMSRGGGGGAPAAADHGGHDVNSLLQRSVILGDSNVDFFIDIVLLRG